MSEPIEKITDEIRALASDMLEVMYDEPGIGLAAPQVGEAVRLIVMDTDWSSSDDDEDDDDDDHEQPAVERRNPLVLVNPEIVHREGKLIWAEGCLSVPDFSADVERAEHVIVRGTNLDGDPVEEEAHDVRAICFQHEIDHLDGVLFIDRISRLKRSMYTKKRKKALREEEDGG
jgi:peptide deformylase